jgi:hypothetical protein
VKRAKTAGPTPTGAIVDARARAARLRACFKATGNAGSALAEAEMVADTLGAMRDVRRVNVLAPSAPLVRKSDGPSAAEQAASLDNPGMRERLEACEVAKAVRVAPRMRIGA